MKNDNLVAGEGTMGINERKTEEVQIKEQCKKSNSRLEMLI